MCPLEGLSSCPLAVCVRITSSPDHEEQQGLQPIPSTSPGSHLSPGSADLAQEPLIELGFQGDNCRV